MNDALLDLPDDVREAIERPGVERDDTLKALGERIARLRDEAVQARRESGIEQTWLECEEAYLGIDDENRGEFAGARWAKPMNMEGPLRKENSSDGVKATAFIKLTARYVDAGSAKVCEIALPVDGKPFTLKATPVPEMAAAAEDNTPAEQVTGEAMPGPDGQPVKVKDLAKFKIEQAEKEAEKSATRIYDWMVEYKHNAEMRKVIFDGSRIGTGIIKGPIPETSSATAVRRTPAGVAVERVEKIKPVARWVDPWRFFPAPGCGEDIHKGGHAFEVDPMLVGELLALGRDAGASFNPEAIDTVIGQGPGKCNLDDYGAPKQDAQQAKGKLFEVWHFHGMIPRAAFEAANEEQASDLDQQKDQVAAIVTIVNDVVIRAVLQPLESARLPYHVFTWRRRAGSWAGVGVGEQVRTPQRIVNAAWRRLLNNAGQSSGSQVVMDAGAVEPANKSWVITPDKLWWLRKDSGIDDVRKAFAAFQWPNTTAQILTIIEAGYRMAEEHTSIPLITQGQSGDTTPDTFGGQQLQDNNANQLLRDVGFGLNDQITTPLVDQFYEWLLLDTEVPDDEKGDYQVDTSGALAIIEKALQDQTIMAMGGMVANPAFKIDPAKWFENWARSKRMNPKDFQYTDADWERIEAQPKPAAPQIEAAKIRAASAEKIAQGSNELASQRNTNDLDRDRAYNDSLAARDQANAALRMEELRLKVRLAELNYATQERLSLQDAKVKLATETMGIQAQFKLAGMDGKGPEVATPPTEPPGRADDGEAYQS